MFFLTSVFFAEKKHRPESGIVAHVGLWKTQKKAGRPDELTSYLREAIGNSSVSKPCTPGEHQNSW